MSLLDIRNLFHTGRSASDDTDSTMLLNHKDAIEFIVDAVPSYGITAAVVRNLQSLLMQGLLANPRALGASAPVVWMQICPCSSTIARHWCGQAMRSTMR